MNDMNELLNDGKWVYTIIGKEIYFKYLGNKDGTDLSYSLYFDWPELKEIIDE